MTLYDMILEKVKAKPMIAVRAGYNSAIHIEVLYEALENESVTLTEGLTLIRECRDIPLIEATLQHLYPSCAMEKVVKRH